MTTAIWWIRRDLRLTDNAALHAALSASKRVIPLFVLDPKILGSVNASSARTAFLTGGLQTLDADLRKRGSHLIVRRGNPVDIVPKVARSTRAQAVYAERDYSPYAKTRDTAVAQKVTLHLQEGVTIRPVGTVLKKNGQPYTVFTPYRNAWLAQAPFHSADIIPAPKALELLDRIDSDDLPTMSSVTKQTLFPPGEAEAKHRLGEFLKGDHAPIFDYKTSRDRPDWVGTSQLSPYLRFGMLSSRLAAVGAFEAIARSSNADSRQGAETWLSELIWRDFYLSILHHFPHVRGNSFRPQYDRINWMNAPSDFDSWCEGQTGYPFIDAAMRQLANTGWMHNRARMAVASFLVKDLLIDWRWGERWFMQQLLDGDPAANNGGWQWSAGTGTDAAPYFRIFNPISQGTKYDPAGDYVRHWVPELARVPAKLIHEPWKMSDRQQDEFGCRLGHNYPLPIVDHKHARRRTLAAYQAVKT